MSLVVERVRALCFDVDGTLSDSDDHYVAQIATVMKRLRVVREPERAARRLVMWMESPGNALLGLTDRLGLDNQVMAAIELSHRWGGRRGRPLPVMAGMSEVLQELHSRFPMAVVSARDEQSTMTFLDQANWHHHFDAIVTALSAAHTKPYPEPVLLAARQMNTSPDSCLMIGDTTVDIRAGKAAGAQTVGVLCGYGEEGELRRAGADLILSRTADLRAVLLEQTT